MVIMTMGKLMLLEVEPGGEGDHGRSRPGARPSTSTSTSKRPPRPLALEAHARNSARPGPRTRLLSLLLYVQV